MTRMQEIYDDSKGALGMAFKAGALVNHKRGGPYPVDADSAADDRWIDSHDSLGKCVMAKVQLREFHGGGFTRAQ